LFHCSRVQGVRGVTKLGNRPFVLLDNHHLLVFSGNQKR